MTKARFAWLCFISIVASGCVTPSTMMVNREGKVMRCSSYGYGYGVMGAIATSTAEQTHAQCVRDAKIVGFVPIPVTALGSFE